MTAIWSDRSSNLLPGYIGELLVLFEFPILGLSSVSCWLYGIVSLDTNLNGAILSWSSLKLLNDWSNSNLFSFSKIILWSLTISLGESVIKSYWYIWSRLLMIDYYLATFVQFTFKMSLPFFTRLCPKNLVLIGNYIFSVDTEFVRFMYWSLSSCYFFYRALFFSLMPTVKLGLSVSIDLTLFAISEVVIYWGLKSIYIPLSAYL
jgi:hypothetical protein